MLVRTIDPRWARCAMGAGACAMLLLAMGCGGGDAGDSTPSTDGDPSTSNGAPAVAAAGDEKVYKYSLKEISPIGDYLPPLDGGRIELAPPKDWKVGIRQSDMVVWFHQYKDPRLLPQIRVTAQDAPQGAPQEASVDGASEYAAWVDKWVQEQIKEETLVESVVPLVLGENAFGRYVRAGRYKSSDAHRQILVTTQGGRVYTIETIVFAGELKESRKTVLDGYAVGGSLRASEGGGVGGFEPPGEPQ